MRNVLDSEERVLHEALSNLTNLDSIDLVLRQCLTIDEMREAGSFFTGGELAKHVVNSFVKPFDTDSVILDPTCGAGNLLIECSRRLSVCTTLSATMEMWGQVLWGFDLNKSFVETTKLRLLIEALSRGVEKDCNVDEALKFLKHIENKDAMEVGVDELIRVTHAIMNPPFSIWGSPKSDYWKSGKVNAAGVIFDHYARRLPEGCEFSAILPDVLRSGTRYEGFREFISNKADAVCEIWGRFNNKTDVDVFILFGLFSDNIENKILWSKDFGKYVSISSYFDVCVGPLVAYRDEERGELVPYYHPRNTPAWECIDKPSELREFSGKLLQPPFVLVKRTSSPSDKYRASATIINLKVPVAVENHMLVLTPKNGSLKDCFKLLKTLRDSKTNDFLNDRCRMRHLTVKVVKDIPF